METAPNQEQLSSKELIPQPSEVWCASILWQQPRQQYGAAWRGESPLPEPSQDNATSDKGEVRIGRKFVISLRRRLTKLVDTYIEESRKHYTFWEGVGTERAEGKNRQGQDEIWVKIAFLLHSWITTGVEDRRKY